MLDENRFICKDDYLAKFQGGCIFVLCIRYDVALHDQTVALQDVAGLACNGDGVVMDMSRQPQDRSSGVLKA